MAQRVGHGIHDTIRVYAEILPNGDTIPLSYLPDIYVYANLTPYWKEYYKEWKRLKNAVYVTYPYALQAASTLNQINKAIAAEPDKRKQKEIIRSKEKEVKAIFNDKIKELSVYQGKVLMKLIYRETGNNCYDILQEYKGWLPANFYQGIAQLFSSSLKQPYNPMINKTDKMIEIVAREIEMKRGYYDYHTVAN